MTQPSSTPALNVSALVRRLDTEAWDIQAAVDEARAPRLAYERAFGIARAANSVLACLENSAPTAAAQACYEAYHATQDVEALISIGREFLIPESRQDCAGSR